VPMADQLDPQDDDHSSHFSPPVIAPDSDVVALLGSFALPASYVDDDGFPVEDAERFDLDAAYLDAHKRGFHDAFAKAVEMEQLQDNLIGMGFADLAASPEFAGFGMSTIPEVEPKDGAKAKFD